MVVKPPDRRRLEYELRALGSRRYFKMEQEMGQWSAHLSHLGPSLLLAISNAEGNTLEALNRAQEICRKLEEGRRYADHILGLNGMKKVRFMIAAYNVGIPDARLGTARGDPDAYTENGRFSKDVLQRWSSFQSIVREWSWF